MTLTMYRFYTHLEVPAPHKGTREEGGALFNHLNPGGFFAAIGPRHNLYCTFCFLQRENALFTIS